MPPIKARRPIAEQILQQQQTKMSGTGARNTCVTISDGSSYRKRHKVAAPGENSAIHTGSTAPNRHDRPTQTQHTKFQSRLLRRGAKYSYPPLARMNETPTLRGSIPRPLNRFRLTFSSNTESGEDLSLIHISGPRDWSASRMPSSA